MPEALIRQSLRAGLSDGWGGSMMGTEFSDVMFGTPKPIDTTANIGVMEKDNVNIIVHGHDPSLSEMIVFYANDPEMIAYAKENGAKGITVAGVCCTSNEVTMRHGIPMAGNFLNQENVVLTGACEAIVVDVQCIFPALGPLSKCFHTKFITTSPIARIPDSDFIEFHAESAGENAKNIVKTAIENFKNRRPELVNIPELKTKARVGYSLEAIKKELDGVCNSHVDTYGTTKPLIDCVKAGVLRGAVAMVGCNNPKVRPDTAHIELMKKLLKNDIIVILSGCSAQAAAKAGLMDPDAKENGAKGITVAGVCCTSNEVTMRHGIPMAGNFLSQENVVLTGACEAIVVDVQCIFPALGPLSKCFHTKFITTSPIARIPDSDFIEFHAESAGENAKKSSRPPSRTSRTAVPSWSTSPT